MIGGLLVTHGPMASAIIEAASSIIGKAEKIVAVSTSEYSLRSLITKLEELVTSEKFNQGIIIMASLKGGTCWNAAVAVARKLPEKVEVVSGVNLNMFLSYITKRERYQLSELAQIIQQDAIKGIDQFKN